MHVTTFDKHGSLALQILESQYLYDCIVLITIMGQSKQQRKQIRILSKTQNRS